MNKDLGTVVTALVTDKNEQAYFVQKSGVTYRLAKTEVEAELDLGIQLKGSPMNQLKKSYPSLQIFQKVRLGTLVGEKSLKFEKI